MARASEQSTSKARKKAPLAAKATRSAKPKSAPKKKPIAVGETQEQAERLSLDHKPSLEPRGVDREEEIRVRAYYRSLERGAGSGSAVDDWLAAEEDLREGEKKR